MREILEFRWLVFGMVLGLMPGPTFPAVTQLDPAIDARLDTQESVRVVVMFTQIPGQAFDRALPDQQRIAQIQAVREQILSALTGHAVSRRVFSLIPGFAAEVDAEALAALKSHPLVEQIDLDLPGGVNMAQGGPLAEIPDVYAAGLTGAGAKVAIVDTGIDTDHADFTGRIVAQQCMCSGPAGETGCCPNGLDTQSGAGSAEDGNGHGTNVAGIAVGGGVVALRGGAPAASIVAVRVMDNGGSFCCLSDVAAAFDWVRTNHPDTRVLNASLGSTALYTPSCDGAFAAMTSAVDNLVANGTLVVVSSGNNGSSTQMNLPACIANSFAVGAVWDSPQPETTFLGCTDSVILAATPTCFTNSNSSVDIYAPGAYIQSSGNGGGLSSYGGTSQASPMAAGCAAALRAWKPAATVAEISAALKASPTTVTDPKNGLVFPLLDCLGAMQRFDGLMFFNGFEQGND